MKQCEVDYCEFVVWRPAELVTFRIPADGQFINSAIDKATKLYIKGILPEMLGKWYSKTHHTPEISPTSLLVTSETSSSTMSTDKWCFCQSEEHETMIGCDSDSCSIGWYHIDCLNIDSIPSSSWYCLECSGNMSNTFIQFYNVSTFQSNGTTDSQALHNAQHTVTILSIKLMSECSGHIIM